MEMKQFTKEEAIKFYDSEVWKNWSDEEIVRLQLFQDNLCVDFERFHGAIEKVLGHAVFTHEFAFIDNLRKEYLGEEQAPTLKEIIELMPKDKRAVIIA